jgi:hypothetical protein
MPCPVLSGIGLGSITASWNISITNGCNIQRAVATEDGADVEICDARSNLNLLA